MFVLGSNNPARGVLSRGSFRPFTTSTLVPEARGANFLASFCTLLSALSTLILFNAPSRSLLASASLVVGLIDCASSDRASLGRGRENPYNSLGRRSLYNVSKSLRLARSE